MNVSTTATSVHPGFRTALMSLGITIVRHLVVQAQKRGIKQEHARILLQHMAEDIAPVQHLRQ